MVFLALPTTLPTKDLIIYSKRDSKSREGLYKSREGGKGRRAERQGRVRDSEFNFTFYGLCPLSRSHSYLWLVFLVPLASIHIKSVELNRKHG